MLVATVGSKNPSFFSVCAARNPGGRPKGANPRSERTLKPWLAEGVSERTYRRRKQPSTEQHSAHVVAWAGTRTGMQILEYRAMARRCIPSRRCSLPASAILALYMNALGVN